MLTGTCRAPVDGRAGRTSRFGLRVLILILCGVAVGPVVAESYRLPPAEVVELLDAPRRPLVQLSPDARWLTLAEYPAMPSLADVARPWVGLAGLRVDPDYHARHRVSFSSGLLLQAGWQGPAERVELPDPARIMSLLWSHTNDRLALTRATDQGVELWVVSVETRAARRVARFLNTLFVDVQWMPDGQRLLAAVKPDDGPARPERPTVPQGPSVQETSGRRSPARTFQDLLQDEYDAQLFEHFTRCQLVLVDPDREQVDPLGSAGLIVGAAPSPDGKWFLVYRLKRPFSYTLPHTRFPLSLEIWDGSGQRRHVLADLPLADEVPIQGVRTGPRSVSWRPGKPASLVWVEALDGGDPNRQVEHRDAWRAWAAPFETEPRELLRTQHRARGLTWFANPARVLAAEYDRDRRWVRALLHDRDAPDDPPVVLEDRSVHDRYGDPGNILTRVQADGTRIARQTGDGIYRIGRGDSPTGARPFLDRQQLSDQTTARLWQSEPGCFETVIALIDDQQPGGTRMLTRYEDPVTPPNVFLRDWTDPAFRKPLTEFPDPQPQIRGIQRELVTYERSDGVPLSATLYLPRGYTGDTPLPLVVWAYPRDYSDPATAGQISGSPDQFTEIRGASQLVFLLQGYAVLDNAAMPIVGDPESMNDTFIEQIELGARAAIEMAVERGVADPHRVGVGGHSYGAFMAVNLMAHTDLFRAGCARSGAYNRTLTPFGFQAERRTLWEAPDVYTAVSPFLHAHQIRQPLLILHGAADNNSGTFPLQSERLYHALAGLGGTARLVMLPAEGHGYLARESVLHAVAEMLDWFERYVKQAAPRTEVESEGG